MKKSRTVIMGMPTYSQVQEVTVTRYNASSTDDGGTAEENVIVWVGYHDWISLWHFKNRSQVQGVSDQFFRDQPQLLQTRLKPFVGENLSQFDEYRGGYAQLDLARLG